MKTNLVPLINTLCFSSLTILLFCCLVRKIHVISIHRYFITLIIFALVARLFIPLEFPCQHNLYITKIYPNIYHYFINAKIIYHKKEYYLSSIVTMLLLLGSLVCLCKLIFSYIIMLYNIKKYRSVKNDVINNILKQIGEELKYKKQFQIVYSPHPTTPYLFGLFHPIIVVPEITLSDYEWQYIFKHELSHNCHQDLWIRFACECLRIIYWWNPFIYLLRYDIIAFQEYSADLSVTQNLNESEKLDYAQCLIKMAKLQSLQNNNCSVAFISQIEIKKRIAFFLESFEKKKTKEKGQILNFAMAISLLISTLILPNFIILEPRGELPKEVTENTTAINNENSYLILRKDEKFDIYVDNKYFSTVTTVFDDTLPIYNEEGGLIK